MLHKEVCWLEQLGAGHARRHRHAPCPPAQSAAWRDQEPLGAWRPVHDLTALSEDIEALLALIDDYVGMSNTNMHLRAGAGRTARVLMPRLAEWRWMISGNESPWFPGFHIYRQKPDGNWSAALERLRGDLLAAFGGSRLQETLETISPFFGFFAT